MVAMNPKWNYTYIDHRGHWVPKIDEAEHWLSNWATSHRYETELAGEGLPESELNKIEGTRLHLRSARVRGFLEIVDEGDLSRDDLELIADACRREGIPVIDDYPASMRHAVRSYGKLLAALFSYNPYFESLVPDENDSTEEAWAKRLAATLRILGSWQTVVVEDTRWVHHVPIPGFPTEEQERRERVASNLDLFGSVAHQFPDLLQSYLTLADHLKLDVPTLKLVNQPTTQLWSAFDVTSSNFLRLVRAQPGFFSAMDGHQFEQLVAKTFRENGFEVVATKRSRDGGFDLRLIVPLMSKLKVSFLVECKNPQAGGVVGVSVVRGLRGVGDELRRGTAGGIVVTSTTFSEDARREAKASGWAVSLFEKNDLLELLDAASLRGPR
jgi:hypothetical protein